MSRRSSETRAFRRFGSSELFGLQRRKFRPSYTARSDRYRSFSGRGKEGRRKGRAAKAKKGVCCSCAKEDSAPLQFM